MAKYEKTHYVDGITGVRITTKTDNGTGEKAKGYGGNFEESDEDADDTLYRADENDPDYSPGESVDSGSDSGCYLTTACINSRGLADNCLELQVLRKFRDKILVPSSAGKKLVREYYSIAPEIVQAVNEQGIEQAEIVWKNVYGDIRKAISLISKRDFDGAVRHYKEMTLKLKGEYLN